MCITSMPGPATVDDHRVIDHIEVPVVIAVGPCSATVELCAGAGKQFAGKAVGIASIVGAVVGATVVFLCYSYHYSDVDIIVL